MVVDLNDEALAHYLLQDNQPNPVRIVIVDPSLLSAEYVLHRWRACTGLLDVDLWRCLVCISIYAYTHKDVAFRGEQDPKPLKAYEFGESCTIVLGSSCFCVSSDPWTQTIQSWLLIANVLGPKQYYWLSVSSARRLPISYHVLTSREI